MKLYTLGLRHYGPKSSESGTHQLLVANNEEEVLQWCIDKDLFSKDDLDEQMEHSGVIEESDVEDYSLRSKETGVVFEHDFSDYYDMKGTKRELLLLNRGDFEEGSDFFYGHTEYFWDAGKEVTASQVQVLEDLGLVQNLAL